MLRAMRVLMAAIAAVCTLCLAVSTANATTHPYSTTSGTGTLAMTGLGAGSCSLYNVTARSTSASSISVTSFRWRDCTGAITGIVSVLFPITLSVNLATSDPAVSATFPGITITNILGGRCLYSGTVRGTGTDGTGNLAASGTLTNNAGRSSGFCVANPGITLSLSLPGMSF